MKTGFSVTTLIRATPRQVFWFLADPLTAPVIDPAVISYEPVGGTMGPGVVNNIRMRMLGVPTGVGGRVVAAMSAPMFARNATAQQERVRVVLEAALRLGCPGSG